MIQKASSPILAVYTFTLFLSAALMFGLQPMIGKMLLPLVGGTPAGWIVAMAFFQVMLLAGYFLAYALSFFGPRTQGILYLLCIGIGCFFLPVSLTARSSAPGAFDIFWLLTIVVAVPFIALSASASTLQRLFMTTSHTSAKDPYFLYASSNLGSFTGLFLYLLLIEPKLTLTEQSQYWFYGYGLLLFAGTLCLLLAKRAGKPVIRKSDKKVSPVSWQRRMEWLVLAFFPSALMLGVTTHITTDIFSAPMIWVLPLGLYLLTFVIAFSKKPVISYQSILTLQPIIVALSIALLFVLTADVRVSWLSMGWHLLAFTVVALMCHMRLVSLRPAESDRELTVFYLMLAVGGALGGILNAFIFPVLLDQLIEYPFMLIASCLMHPGIRSKIPAYYKRIFIFCLVGGAIYYILRMTDFGQPALSEEQIGGMGDILLALLLVAMALHPRTTILGCTIATVFAVFIMPKDLILTHRNFYGVVKVLEQQIPIDDRPFATRFMYHGATTHGFQVIDPAYEKTPTAYFTAKGPVGHVFNSWKPKKVAIIGLGTGTMNCFRTPRNTFTFFEIDPAVVKIANENFTFLSKCSFGKEPRIIVGDGRLELAKLKNEKFDLIILDAFSSDTIPTHLLTTDAIEEYLKHLENNGLLLFNISNRYFDLAATLSATARSIGLSSRFISDPALSDPFALSSRWVVVTKEDSSLKPLTPLGWEAVEAPKSLRPWTDNYTNLLRTLQF